MGGILSHAYVLLYRFASSHNSTNFHQEKFQMESRPARSDQARPTWSDQDRLGPTRTRPALLSSINLSTRSPFGKFIRPGCGSGINSDRKQLLRGVVGLIWRVIVYTSSYVYNRLRGFVNCSYTTNKQPSPLYSVD